MTKCKKQSFSHLGSTNIFRSCACKCYLCSSSGLWLSRPWDMYFLYLDQSYSSFLAYHWLTQKSQVSKADAQKAESIIGAERVSASEDQSEAGKPESEEASSKKLPKTFRGERCWDTSSTAPGGSGSFNTPKPKGMGGCCESRMAA